MNPRTYYNEFDPKAAAWLRALIAAGHIAPGDVDERSIREVRGADLAGYAQCHFFAGIGGWSYALRLVGWPDDAPVWTGSCPCQPFSCAGKGKGTQDERHLWPEFARLIGECHPPTIFGEQVASRAGREWLAGVFADLEAMAYLRAGADLCAAGAGAPHIRQRLWWVANSQRARFAIQRIPGQVVSAAGLPQAPRGKSSVQPEDLRADGRMGHSGSDQWRGRVSLGRSLGPQQGKRWVLKFTGPSSPWWPAEAVLCRDTKTRRIEPGLEPLAHGVPGRVAQLRGLGNAIVPQVAAVFIRACLAELKA